MVTAQAPWADFVAAVLDGHNGRRAAETCAVRLVAVVEEELARLAPGGAALDAHADASSPNWHPQARVGARRQREAASASQFGPSQRWLLLDRLRGAKRAAMRVLGQTRVVGPGCARSGAAAPGWARQTRQRTQRCA